MTLPELTSWAAEWCRDASPKMPAVIVKYYPPRRGQPDLRRGAILKHVKNYADNKAIIDAKYPLKKDREDEKFSRDSETSLLNGIGPMTKARLAAGGVNTVGDLLDADDATVDEIARVHGVRRTAFMRYRLQAEQILAGQLRDPLQRDPKAQCPLCGEEFYRRGDLRNHVSANNKCFMRLERPFVPRKPGSDHNDISCAGRFFYFDTADSKTATGHFPGDDASVFVWYLDGEHLVHMGDWRDIIKSPIRWIM